VPFTAVIKFYITKLITDQASSVGVSSLMVYPTSSNALFFLLLRWKGGYAESWAASKGGRSVLGLGTLALSFSLLLSLSLSRSLARWLAPL